MLDKLYFAKTKPNAVIPYKRDEDAGYDIFPCFDEDELYLEKGKPTLVPTGIATAFSDDYFFNTRHERGSTGKLGMSVLSGVVDSGYRGEIFINLVSLYKDIIISKSHPFDKKPNGKLIPTETEDVIIYPYSQAIAQGTLEYVPKLEVEELSYEELEKIPSQRGKNNLGSTN